MIIFERKICSAAIIMAALINTAVPSYAQSLSSMGSEGRKVQRQLRAGNDEGDIVQTRRLQATCDTAFVYCSSSVDKLFCPWVTSKWGNSINNTGTETALSACEIFAGRGQCDPLKGYKVGTANISKDQITLNTKDYHYFIDVLHVIKGVCPSDKNNGILKSPGLWPMNLEEDTVSATINIDSKNGTRIFPLNTQTCLTIHMNVCPKITAAPSAAPSSAPSAAPSSVPSSSPSLAPSSSPTTYNCEDRPDCPTGQFKLQLPDENNHCCSGSCCDACPENTICQENSVTECICIECNCGFCTGDGQACCEPNANGVNCKPVENTANDCKFQTGDFPAFISDGNACSGVENNEKATANGCGCKPNESTTCTFGSNPGDTPCFVCRSDEMDKTCDNSAFSCAHCQSCITDCGDVNQCHDDCKNNYTGSDRQDCIQNCDTDFASCTATCETDCYKESCPDSPP